MSKGISNGTHYDSPLAQSYASIFVPRMLLGPNNNEEPNRLPSRDPSVIPIDAGGPSHNSRVDICKACVIILYSSLVPQSIFLILILKFRNL